MAKKRGFHAGAWEAFNFMGVTAEIAGLAMAQRLRDSGDYKKLGYDTWEECCLDQFRCTDEAMRKKLKTLKEIGPQTLSACRELGFEWKEIRLLSMPDQADNIKQGFLMIEDKKVPITTENAEIIKLYVDGVEKDKKLAAAKVAGIEKEHKKELKAYTAEIEELKLKVAEPEIPEEIDEFFKVLIEKKVDDIVIAAGRLRLNMIQTAPMELKRMYEVRINMMETQLMSVLNDMREAIRGQ